MLHLEGPKHSGDDAIGSEGGWSSSNEVVLQTATPTDLGRVRVDEGINVHLWVGDPVTVAERRESRYLAVVEVDHPPKVALDCMLREVVNPEITSGKKPP